MKSKLIMAAGILLCVGLGFFFPMLTTTKSYDTSNQLAVDSGTETPLLQQHRLGVTDQTSVVNKLYVKDQLLGVITDMTTLDRTLKKVYKASYEADFPDTSLGLGEDLYLVQEQSYYAYDDIDEQIMEYLTEHDLFSVVTNKIEFSNGAVIYVKNVDDFTAAREMYLLNFISKDIYDILKANQTPTPLATFGEQEISLNVAEKMTVSEGLASRNEIMTTQEEIIEFLSYGYGVEKEYYTVKPYDTVDGVASQAKTGISTQQLITINPGVLTDANQVLSPGMQLNITYFDSPLTVTVVKERLAEEKVYPDSTKYIFDDTLEAGTTIKVTKEVIGKRNVRYHDTYVNGILTKGEEISSVITEQPVQEVIRVGTMGDGDYGDIEGSGSFIYPTRNPRIICGWGCYSGHYAIDVQNRYNVWGDCIAADSGTVVSNAYDSIGGYHVTIDHGNGYQTYYGHFRQKSPLKVGQKVTRGQFIGKIGMTGYATAPHVHFEIWIGKAYRGGRRINPCKLLGC